MQVQRFLVLLSLLSCCLVSAGTAQSPSPSNEARKIVRKTIPNYPEVAKRMNLAGTVKVLVTVAPDGTVKNVQPMGGSPLLIQAAQDAVYKWKFTAASSESKELIELHFDPQ
jgi:TonB family protein